MTADCCPSVWSLGSHDVTKERKRHESPREAGNEGETKARRQSLLVVVVVVMPRMWGAGLCQVAGSVREANARRGLEVAGEVAVTVRVGQACGYLQIRRRHLGWVRRDVEAVHRVRNHCFCFWFVVCC